jgi:hypothetical protein
MEETFSKFIDQELILDCAKEANINQTASKHENDLRDRLLNEDLSRVIVKGSYHVDIDDTELIQATTHDLAKRVNNAVHSAIDSYWRNRWAIIKVNNMSEDVLRERINNIAGKAEQTKETIIKQEKSMCNINNDVFDKAVNRC